VCDIVSEQTEKNCNLECVGSYHRVPNLKTHFYSVFMHSFAKVKYLVYFQKIKYLFPRILLKNTLWINRISKKFLGNF